MRLMTKALEAKLQKYPLDSQDGIEKKRVIAKFFNPMGRGTWYVTEGEKQPNGDWLFFGLVDLFEQEWGYFTLSSLEGIRLPYDLGIERDRYFDHAKSTIDINTNQITL